MNTKLFVYGSLKIGFHNHARCKLNRCKFLGLAHTVRQFTMVSLGSYPALHPHQDDAHSCKIYGEIYDVPEDIFAPIYRMEVGAGYSQLEVALKCADAWTSAHLFFHDRPIRFGAIIISDGIWKDRDDMTLVKSHVYNQNQNKSNGNTIIHAR